MIQVAESVYVATDVSLCNLGVITTREGIAMIDTPIRPSEALKWREEVSKMGEIRYLINNEEHPDHSQTTWFFPGILISHQETRDALAKIPEDQFMEQVKKFDPDGLHLIEGMKLRLADITFTDRLNLYLGEHTFELFHLPGHTPGGIGVYIPEEGVVFATDIIFHKEKSWLHDSTPEQWLESLEKLAKMDLGTIVPGHGSICKKDYLEEQADIIRRWVEVVKSAIDRGLSEEEAVAGISCPDPYPADPKKPFSAEYLNELIITRLYQLYTQ